jgi:ABC-type nitrate/sulfonate/bicarbonate transport system substrate-binding protein
MKRRDFLTTAAAATVLTGAPWVARAQGAKFTEWGWPQPYEMISEGSIKWLKSKDWWPLTIGNQPGFTGIPVTIGKGLYRARGLEATVVPFLSGPAINEAAAAGRVQAGLEGNFPFTTLISKDMPVRCLGAVNPCLKHATVVPPASPLKSLAELKNAGSMPAFGIVVGSSAEFYFTEALRLHGLVGGKDVVLKNMKPTDMLIMPSGLDGFVQWAPYTWEHLLIRKNARQIDAIFPYNFFMGNFWIRQEIVENAPDVAQAYFDGWLEGILYSQLNLADAIKTTQEDPMYKSFPREIVDLNIGKNNNLYKPTWCYPDRAFWSQENGRVAKWLHDNGRLEKPVSAEKYAGYIEPRFAEAAFAKLGWRVPERPTFLPAGWNGKVGQPPYPEYYNEDNLTAPQPFPAPGDLVKDWSFGGKDYKA